MKTETSILKTLSQSDLVREYERAFEDATGLPVSTVAEGDWHLSHQGLRHSNAFCALVTSHSKTCAACLQRQSSIRRRAGKRPSLQTCPYGLVEAAVPIRLGAETAGFFVTGQVLCKRPSETQFRAVAKKLDPSINQEKARDAYFLSRVIEKKALKSSLRLLSLFAEHLAIKGNQLAVQVNHSEPAAMTKARHYLADHIEENVSLGQVARASGASSFYLCKLFRKHLGMTFTEYISRCRVERAK